MRRRSSETESAADQRGAGERILDIVADITRDDSAPKIVRATMEHFGRLDILINNAGINTCLLRPEGQPVGKFWEVTPTEFRRVIDVNVVAVFLMTRAALPVMLKQALGPHHQRDDEPRHHVSRRYAALWRLQGGERGASPRHGAGARWHWRHRQRAGAGWRGQYAARVARPGA